MKYYIDNQRLAVYKELPNQSRVSNPESKDNRIVIVNPNEDKIYLDILERVDDVWIKLRFYENRMDETTREKRLHVFEAYSTMLPENHIKIEGLHDAELFDGRFNIQKLEPPPANYRNNVMTNPLG